MRLIDADTYALYTGDRDTDADSVDEAIDEATQLLEERLRRSLAYGSYTERLPFAGPGVGWLDGFTVYPAVTPIDSSDDGTVDGDSITGVHVASDPFDTSRVAEVTYLGGFTPDTLPRSIARDLAACAKALVDQRPSTSDTETLIPAGATSARVGDIAIGFGPGGAGTTSSAAGGAASGSFEWSAHTLSWRRRSL